MLDHLASEAESEYCGRMYPLPGEPRMNKVEEPCELCGEFVSGVCPYELGVDSRILFRNDNFIIIAALGSFIDGYVLICPREHKPSFAYLDRKRLKEASIIIRATEQILTTYYVPPTAFEHGATQSGLRAGGCIDHAHLHVVPGNPGLDALLRSSFCPVELNDWPELGSWIDTPYLLAKAPGDGILVSPASDGLPSQFLRVCPRTLGGVAELSQHQADGSETQKGKRLAVEIFPILGQPAAAVEPGEGALDNPAFG